MSYPHRPRPSDRAIPPADVTDILLWRLAVDVATAHQPGDDGRCRNLQCTHHTGPCPAFTHARQALRTARTPQPAPPVPAPPQLPAPARGQATVPTAHRTGFTGWFTASARAATRHLNAALTALPRRRPGATLTAA
jgi:hypothetical protein